MAIDLRVLKLEERPALVAFLAAETLADILSTLALLRLSPFFPDYPYEYRPASVQNTISICEICAALGKVEHLKQLLSATQTSNHVCLDSELPGVEQIPLIIKSPIFYEGLMHEALSNNQVEMVNFLLPSINHRLESFVFSQTAIRCSLVSLVVFFLKAYLAPYKTEVEGFVAAIKIVLEYVFLWGRLDVLEILLDPTCDVFQRQATPETGRSIFLRVLQDNRTKFLELAIRSKSLKLLEQYLLCIDYLTPSINFRAPTATGAFPLLKLAIDSSSVEVLMWLSEVLPIDLEHEDTVKLLEAVLFGARAEIFNCLIRVPCYKALLIKHHQHLFYIAISHSSLYIIEQLLTFEPIKAALAVKTVSILSRAVRRGNLPLIERLLLCDGVCAELQDNSLILLGDALNNGENLIVDVLLARVQTISDSAYRELPKEKDPLYIAANLCNRQAIRSLLGNVTIRSMAQSRDFYSGERFGSLIREVLEGINYAGVGVSSFFGGGGATPSTLGVTEAMTTRP